MSFLNAAMMVGFGSLAAPGLFLYKYLESNFLFLLKLFFNVSQNHHKNIFDILDKSLEVVALRNKHFGRANLFASISCRQNSCSRLPDSVIDIGVQTPQSWQYFQHLVCRHVLDKGLPHAQIKLFRLHFINLQFVAGDKANQAF